MTQKEHFDVFMSNEERSWGSNDLGWDIVPCDLCLIYHIYIILKLCIASRKKSKESRFLGTCMNFDSHHQVAKLVVVDILLLPRMRVPKINILKSCIISTF